MPQFRGYSGNWVPLVFGNSEIDIQMSRLPIWQGMAEIERLLENRGDKSTELQLPYPPDLQNCISNILKSRVFAALMISRTSLIRIIDAVRNIILKWSMKLEEDGILGEDLSFTSQEKVAAENPVYNTVNNFYGTVQNQQIQQHTSSSSQTMNIEQSDLSSLKEFLEKILNQIDELNLTAEGREELVAEIKTAEIQISSPKPKHPIIRESLSTIRRILEITSGGVAARLLVDYGPVLQSWFF
jgi:hypothetical protein